MQGRKLVGFVGVGVMGRPMSQRLIEAGYDVLVHDRDAAAMAALQALGARIADSARAVADEAVIGRARRATSASTCCT